MNERNHRMIDLSHAVESAAPVKVKGIGSFPARAYGVVESASTTEPTAPGPGHP